MKFTVVKFLKNAKYFLLLLFGTLQTGVNFTFGDYFQSDLASCVHLPPLHSEAELTENQPVPSVFLTAAAVFAARSSAALSQKLR